MLRDDEEDNELGVPAIDVAADEADSIQCNDTCPESRNQVGSPTSNQTMVSAPAVTHVSRSLPSASQLPVRNELVRGKY